MKKIVILGGGVAGLTAAHELIERGFAVEVYEKRNALGGKALSDGKPGSATPPQKVLPGEHGFRFFPGFYQHIPDTMKRIPFPGNANGVFDNLVPATETAIARPNKPLYKFPNHLPVTIDDWILMLEAFFGGFDLGLELGERKFFIERLIDIMTMCDKRRFAELEHTQWWKYIDAENRSDAYQNLLARGLTRSLVAMRAEEASTRTVGFILIQMLMSMTSDSRTVDRVLNAPTSDAWIDPWVKYLADNGVAFNTEADVQGINFDGAKITGVVVASPAGVQTVAADYYVVAFPFEVTDKLCSDRMKAAAPSLARLKNLKSEWMNGLQFYLKRDVPISHGHLICANSTWAITVISQTQFWDGVDFSKYGVGNVKGLISIDISDWTQPGYLATNKPADQCTEKEIVDEAWAQLVDHFAATSDPLTDADLVDYYLDPAIVPKVENKLPLLVNTIGSWADRPNATTEIPNMFLASDYVRTNTDLATMESASEAARRAANEIIKVSGSNVEPCLVGEFHEPPAFEPLKRIDEILFNLGLPHPSIRTLKGIAWTFKLLRLI